MTATNLIAVISFFCGCHKCVGAENITAFNRRPIPWRTAACNWLPRGTRFKVDGLKPAFAVEDRLPSGRWYSDRIDLYVGTGRGRHAQARKLGVRTNLVTLLP